MSSTILTGTISRKNSRTDIPSLPFLFSSFHNADQKTHNNRQARLNGFEDDLKLTGNQYNVALSILNVSYLLTQIPR